MSQLDELMAKRLADTVPAHHTETTHYCADPESCHHGATSSWRALFPELSWHQSRCCDGYDGPLAYGVRGAVTMTTTIANDVHLTVLGRTVATPAYNDREEMRPYLEWALKLDDQLQDLLTAAGL